MRRREQHLASEQPFKGGLFKVQPVLKSSVLGESASPSACLPPKPRSRDVFPFIPRSKAALLCLSCTLGSHSAAEEKGQGRYSQSKVVQTALADQKQSYQLIYYGNLHGATVAQLWANQYKEESNTIGCSVFS